MCVCVCGGGGGSYVQQHAGLAGGSNPVTSQFFTVLCADKFLPVLCAHKCHAASIFSTCGFLFKGRSQYSSLLGK